MLKLEKDNALTRWQLAKKAKKKIPLYEGNYPDNGIITNIDF